MKLVPYLFAVYWYGRDHELLDRVEIGLVGIREVWVVLQEVVELVGFGLEFLVLVLEHANGTASVDYEDFALVLAHHGAFVLFAGVDLLVEVDFADELFLDFGFVHRGRNIWELWLFGNQDFLLFGIQDLLSFV